MRCEAVDTVEAKAEVGKAEAKVKVEASQQADTVAVDQTNGRKQILHRNDKVVEYDRSYQLVNWIGTRRPVQKKKTLKLLEVIHIFRQSK